MNPEFVRLLESLANGVVIADSAGTITFTNHFLERIFGYEPGELLKQPVETLLPADLRGLHSRHRAQYNTAPETRLMGAGRDLLARHKDGSVFPVEVGLSPIQTSDGMRVVAIVTDITMRKHAEQRSVLQRDVAVVLSEADSLQSVASKLLQTIGTALGWSAGVFWLMDPEKHELRNAATWKASGVKAAEVGETRAIRLSSGFDVPIIVGAQTLGVMEFFSQYARLADEAVMDIAGAVASQIGQFMQRKRSESALGIFEERYRSLFENAVFGIYRSTAAGEILDVNPALAAMLEYDSVDEVLALNLIRDVYKNPRDRERLIEQSQLENRFDAYEVDWKTKKGGTIQVRLSGRVVRTDDGALAGFEAIVENITQRRLLEQQFRQAQKMEAIGRLAGGVAHDFNNLLTIIAVSTDTLTDQSAGNESMRQTIDEIARTTEQGASLVRQLMAFSRSQPQTIHAVDLNHVIIGAHRMLGILAGEDIDLNLNLHQEPCLVAIESTKIEQILMNLVSNSHDAMSNGGTLSITTDIVEIDTELAGLYMGLKPAKHVMLRVADTGQGIPPHIQAQIFEPFFTTKEPSRGTGLGLSTVYGIVRQHDGHIVCESVVDEGTTFTVFLPMAAPEETSVTKTQAAPKTRHGSETILLVEDEPALRTSVRRILEQNGYKVIAAADGPEALKASEENPAGFDLLVTDIALPQMRGTDLARRLTERYPQLRVLYMSGYSEEKVPSGGAQFIAKPFRRDALIHKIREVLDRV